MATRSGEQYKLFDTETRLPSGLVYKPDFITPEEEEMLIIFIGAQPMKHATGGPNGEYEAKRRWAHFGWGYDFKNEKLIPGPPLPRFLQRFAHRIEKWRGWERGRVVEALVNEYTPGTALGFHRDNEQFEHVIGLSLSGWCTIKFRPMKTSARKPEALISLELEPRSCYLMQGDIRWGYQHAVAATKTLRYSITFRTLPEGMRIPKADKSDLSKIIKAKGVRR
jgi:alkylated DNA repair dioxygenase AlkB